MLFHKPFSLSVNRIIQILLLFLFVLNLGSALFGPIFGIFATQGIQGATLKTVGFAVGILAIVKSIIQIPLAKKIDKNLEERDDFYLMFFGGLIASFYAFTLTIISQIWQLYLLQVLAGVGDACIMAAYYALFSRHTDKGKEAFEWTLFSVWGLTISAALGSSIGGIVADAFGFKILFMTTALLSLISTVLLLLLYPYLTHERLKKQKSRGDI